MAGARRQPLSQLGIAVTMDDCHPDRDQRRMGDRQTLRDFLKGRHATRHLEDQRLLQSKWDGILTQKVLLEI